MAARTSRGEVQAVDGDDGARAGRCERRHRRRRLVAETGTRAVRRDRPDARREHRDQQQAPRGTRCPLLPPRGRAETARATPRVHCHSIYRRERVVIIPRVRSTARVRSIQSRATPAPVRLSARGIADSKKPTPWRWAASRRVMVHSRRQNLFLDVVGGPSVLGGSLGPSRLGVPMTTGATHPHAHTSHLFIVAMSRRSIPPSSASCSTLCTSGT